MRTLARFSSLVALVGLGLAIPARAATDLKTVRMWKSKCGSCHGDDGKAATLMGQKMGVPDLTGGAWQGARSDAKLEAAILNGLKREKDGKAQEMKGFRGELTADQVRTLVGHVRALGGRVADATKAEPEKAEPATTEPAKTEGEKAAPETPKPDAKAEAKREKAAKKAAEKAAKAAAKKAAKEAKAAAKKAAKEAKAKAAKEAKEAKEAAKKAGEDPGSK